jgi:hypothetical protein
MKPPGLLTRLDDLINPIVVKELRQAVQSRLVVSALMLLLVLQMGLLGVFLVAQSVESANRGIDFHAGARIFTGVQIILLAISMLLIPAYAGGRLAAERSDTNVDLLFISSLKPRSIIWGKFVAAVVLSMLIASTCAPFMTFTYLLRGIDIPTILIVLGLDLLAVLTGTQLAIFLAAAHGNRAVKGVLGLAGAGALMAVFGYTLAGTMALIESPGRLPLESREFWAVAGTLVALVLCAMGLLFTWSVALVSPPSANRALASRLFLVAVWLVTGGITFAWAWNYREGIPVLVWMVGMVVLFCLQLAIAINERDHWGPRVARTIPRRWWLRPPAFLFYSGAAGGVLLAMLMIGLTVAAAEFATEAWRDRFPLRGPKAGETVLEVAVVIALFTFCYGLSGVLVRGLLRDRVRPVYTWLVSLVLLGLGSALPALAAYFWYHDRNYLPRESIEWWLLPNPILAVVEVVSGRNWGTNFDTACLWFTGSWAVLVALLCLPWFLRQVDRFRPPRRGGGPNGAAEEVVEVVVEVEKSWG